MTALPAGTADAALALLFPKPNPFVADPVRWVDDRLGEFLWSKQREIAESVVANRYTAVQSCHDSGKSFMASRLASWWIDAHPPGEAFVVSSAPTQSQVETILWREIERAHRKGELVGRITSGAIPQWKLGKEIVGFGRKPQDHVNREEAMAAFQGIHARYVLILLDEAGGIPKWLFDAADTLATNSKARVLAIGNPDDPQAHFAKVCAPGSGWNRIRIDGFETPNFTGEKIPDELRELLLAPEWVEERKTRWGEASPLYISKVRALFPEVSDHTLFPPALLRKCQELELPGTAAGTYGFDIAEEGEDKTIGYRNRGGVIRKVLEAAGQDTDRTTGDISALMVQRPGVPAYIDSVGVGIGVYDALRAQGLAVLKFKASYAPLDPERFDSLKAETFWMLREQMAAGGIDLPPEGEDDDLIAQLGTLQFFHTRKGQIRMETREERTKRGLSSPDRADAAAMSSVPAGGLGTPMRDDLSVDDDNNFLTKEW
jgi:hypothetical protein